MVVKSLAIALAFSVSSASYSSDLPDWLKRPSYRSDAHGTPQFSRGALTVNGIGHRCEADSLSIEQAEERVKWALNCRILPKGTLIAMLYGFNDDGDRVKKDRPEYPLFVKKDAVSSISNAGIHKPDLETCKLPDNVTFGTVCTASCYTPTQLLHTGKGEVPIAKALKKNIPQIRTLSEKSSLDNLSTEVQPVGRYVMSLTETDHRILKFHTSSNHTIEVTASHPLVDGNGKMREAAEFVVGDSLVHIENGIEIITAIEPVSYRGKVYNVEPVSRSMISNVVIVQGFLNGSNRYQNDDLRKMERFSLRSGVNEKMLHR